MVISIVSDVFHVIKRTDLKDKQIPNPLIYINSQMLECTFKGQVFTEFLTNPTQFSRSSVLKCSNRRRFDKNLGGPPQEFNAKALKCIHITLL